MIIWNFGTPEETAQALSDDGLEKQIKAIAQILCNVHWLRGWNKEMQGWELKFLTIVADRNLLPHTNNWGDCKFTQWASECRANYLELVKMGLACNWEYTYRFVLPFRKLEDRLKQVEKIKKYSNAIIWARDNMPDLPDKKECRICHHSSGWSYGLDPLPCHNCNATGEIEMKQTPFPLVIPLDYMAECLTWTLSVKYNEKNEPIQQINIIESYRNYYRAKLQKPKKVKCMECKGTGYYDKIDEYSLTCDLCDHGVIKELPEPQWTRRDKPNWI